MDAVTHVPTPTNETVLDYAPGSPERASLEVALVELGRDAPRAAAHHRWRPRDGEGRADRGAPAARPPQGARRDARRDQGATPRPPSTPPSPPPPPGATSPSTTAPRSCSRPPTCSPARGGRGSTPRRCWARARRPTRPRSTPRASSSTSGASTSTSPARSCEEQPPANSRGLWNRSDYRSLEGFVYAVTPFNFTAIAGNLPTAPALMGNTVVWKPSHSQQLAAQLTMELLEEAGMPPGVINLVTGHGREVSDVALAHPEFAGLHFTGSTAVFQGLWQQIGENLTSYRHYPRIVGETGGKDFVLAHPSADPDVLRTALHPRGVRVPGPEVLRRLARLRAAVGVAADQGRPRRAHQRAADGRRHRPVQLHGRRHRRARLRQAQGRDRPGARDEPPRRRGRRHLRRLGRASSCGPTVVESSDPTDEMFATEYFGPILAVHVYPDRQYSKVLDQMESFAPYALTGAIIAQDRAVIADATHRLRFAAGNFYVNDKPTGAVVGQQPFGGGRASGTNDKAGSAANLLRWTSVRSIKENFVPPTSPRLPPHGLTARLIADDPPEGRPRPALRVADPQSVGPVSGRATPAAGWSRSRSRR